MEGLYEFTLNFDTRPATYTAHRENILPPTQTHWIPFSRTRDDGKNRKVHVHYTMTQSSMWLLKQISYFLNNF